MNQEKLPQHDMWQEQLDSNGLSKWAAYLPSVSNYFSAFVGRQRAMQKHFVDPARIPINFENGIEGLNWTNKNLGYFYYKPNLFSAGNANLDINKYDSKELMLRDRDKKQSFVLADSGGFQIAKGSWEADWKDINCPKAKEKREKVLSWMEAYADYGIILDIPSWTCSSEKSRKATGINSINDATVATLINNEYFIKNRTGECKLLNVLQGSNHTESDNWYGIMKKFCDPKQYSNHFDGWSFASQNAWEPHLALKRLVDCRFDGLLEPGVHDWVHFLGNSDLEWSLLLSDIQRSIRKYHNPKLTISYDCATPFLTAGFGGIYYDTIGKDKDHWTFSVAKGIEGKKYSTDYRSLKEVGEQDGYYSKFEDSPISARLKISDVCFHGPKSLNKSGKVSKNSWDSFSYALIQAHNVWEHIETIHCANKKYDSGIFPAVMTTLTSNKKNGSILYYDKLFCSDIIDSIFQTSHYDEAMKLIDDYDRYWMCFRGRGKCGLKSKNSQTTFNKIFY